MSCQSVESASIDAPAIGNVKGTLCADAAELT